MRAWVWLKFVNVIFKILAVEKFKSYYELVYLIFLNWVRSNSFISDRFGSDWHG